MCHKFLQVSSQYIINYLKNITGFIFLIFYRYAFEGILQAIYDGDRERLQCDEIYCHLRSPKQILKMMDMPSVSYSTTVIALCIWIVCLQVCTYLILKWKAHIAKR